MTTTTRRDLLEHAAAAGLALSALWPLRAAAQVRPERKLILVFAKGGWDVTHALDPKPGLDTIDVPAGQEEVAGGIRIWADASRPRVSEFFRRYGSLSAVVNGVQMMSFVHPDCWKRVLTGTASDASPDLGAITAFEHARALPVPYLVLGQTAYTGPLASISARVGSTKQILGLLDSRHALRSDAEAAGIARPSFSSGTEDRIRKLVLARAERDRAIRGRAGSNQRRFEDFFASIDRARTLREYAGDFGTRSPTLDLGSQVDLAVKALGSGLSHSVHLEYGPFDTHPDNSLQGAYHEVLFGALIRLLDGLAAAPSGAGGGRLLDETVVAVLSEMGRTPKLNAEGGKDHWPVTSALVCGAGVRGGSVLGGTDDRLQARNVDFGTGEVGSSGLQLLFPNLAAGILSLAGVDPKDHLPEAEVFHALAS